MINNKKCFSDMATLVMMGFRVSFRPAVFLFFIFYFFKLLKIYCNADSTKPAKRQRSPFIYALR